MNNSNLAEYRTSKFVRLVKRRGNDYAAYHLDRGGLCIVDYPIAALLRALYGPCNPKELDNAYPVNFQKGFIDVFRDRNFILCRDESEDSQYDGLQQKIDAHAIAGQQIGVVQLVVTNRCNFACKYCFTGSIYSGERRKLLQTAPDNQTMPASAAVEYVGKVVALLEQQGRKFLSVQFFGGEPLVNWPAVCAVLDAFEKPRPSGLSINYSMVTNGSLVTPEIAEKLAKHKVSVVVSFDSPRGVHRPLRSGKDSLPMVIKSLSNLREVGVSPIFNAVFGKSTYSYFDRDLVDFAFGQGVREIGVLLDLDPTFLSERGIEPVVEKLMDVYKYGRSMGVVVTGYWHTCFILMAGYNVLPSRLYKTCSGTGAQLSIEPSGDVFACKGSSGHFGSMDNLVELLSSETYRKYSGRSIKNAEECNDCEIRSFCSGLCLGPLEKAVGDVNGLDVDTCTFYRAIVRELIEEAAPGEIPYFNSPPEVISGTLTPIVSRWRRENGDPESIERAVVASSADSSIALKDTSS